MAGVDGGDENDEVDVRRGRLLDDVAGAVIVDYLGAIVALLATARSDDHAARAGHRLGQRLPTANVSDELWHGSRKDLAALGGISDQGANGNAAPHQAADGQPTGPTGCSDDQDRTFGHLPGLTERAVAREC
jgi:hypothetical protein